MQKVARFEGFIWATAKDRNLSLNDLLDAIARTLDYPGIAQKPFKEKRLLVEKLLRTKPYLLVIDNVETISDDAVRDFLLNLPEPSKSLITTRERKLERVWAISLKGLTETEALALIRNEGKRLSMQALECAKDDVLLRLFEATGGAPLAIKWAVGQISQRGQSLDTVLNALHEARGDIFYDIFDRSWGLLSENARQVLMVMPLFVTSASREAVEATSDVHHFDLDVALGQLVKMSLVDASGDLVIPRYSLHPLGRSYVTAKQQENQALLQDALTRILKYYIQYVKPPEATQVGDPYWDGLSHQYTAQVLSIEWPNVAALIRWALDKGYDRAALDLFLPLVHLLNAWGAWNERLELSYQLCKSAERLNDPVEAWLWLDAIGYIVDAREDADKLEQALEGGRAAACKHNFIDAKLYADYLETRLYLLPEHEDMHRVREIVEAIREKVDSATLFHKSKVHRIVISRMLAAIIRLHYHQKEFAQFREASLLQLELRRSVGENVTTSLLGLARFLLAQGNFQEARKYLIEAEAMPRTKDLADLSYTKAVFAQYAGNLVEAQMLCRDAIEHGDRLGFERDKAKAQKLLKELTRLD